MKKQICILLGLIIITGCTIRDKYDVIIRNGTVYNGTGAKPFSGDIAIKGDTIAAIGNLKYD